MLIKIPSLNLCSKFLKVSLTCRNLSSLVDNKYVLEEAKSKAMENAPSKIEGALVSSKLGLLYVKCTKRNIFCTLIDPATKKVETSCSLSVPLYDNQYNERDNLYTRAVLLGSLLAKKTKDLGYNKLIIYLVGSNKGQLAIIRSFGKVGIEIDSIILETGYPHNGCRPTKARRKKFRSKVRDFN